MKIDFWEFVKRNTFYNIRIKNIRESMYKDLIQNYSNEEIQTLEKEWKVKRVDVLDIDNFNEIAYYFYSKIRCEYDCSHDFEDFKLNFADILILKNISFYEDIIASGYINLDKVKESYKYRGSQFEDIYDNSDIISVFNKAIHDREYTYLNKLIFFDRVDILLNENDINEEDFWQEFDISIEDIEEMKMFEKTPEDQIKIRISLKYNVSLEWLMGVTEYKTIDELYLNSNFDTEEILTLFKVIDYIKYRRENH